ncbi:hypothetical protein FVE85_2824 [Porphyridium purpureum]|uniref:Trafficking protein particle complex subunit 12 n=1 Tax=Porphyridium purpureum TaxID=35688 RepID=A0A5J4YUZ9_PORPP|nr:hypothetical protein FVE85_2824 [Porphyridium purpureum]|eukprot:POR9847..scf227_4
MHDIEEQKNEDAPLDEQAHEETSSSPHVPTMPHESRKGIAFVQADILNKRAVVLSSLVHHHLMYHHYQSAIDAARRLVRLCTYARSLRHLRDSTDSAHTHLVSPAWLVLMRALLYTGQLDGAERVLQLAERDAALEETSSASARIAIDLHVHRGLLLAMRGDMEGATDEFEAVNLLVEDDSRHGHAQAQIAAANNVAVCLVHMGLVGDAIERLEEELRVHTDLALDEGLIFNLCTFYELRFPQNCTEKKKVLAKLSGRLARHGFNAKSITL